MIEIKDKRRCSGCGACINICPKQIISYKEDDEGFIYPSVDKEYCIDCHLCEKACTYIDDKWKLSIQKHDCFPIFYAGQLIDKDELQNVSSGGAFWAFALAIISLNGIVYGAAQKNVDNIFHVRAANIKEAYNLRRSKYFQSDTKNTFTQVKDDLKNGKIVLFSGTGCQIAGLKSFLGKDYPHLYTCDVVCHGVPSRRVWRKYREEKESKEGKKITELVFRNKSIGWSNNQYKIIYNDGTVEMERSTKQLFHAGYLKGLFYRPSCGSCKFSTIPRLSDITLADFWKYEGRFHDAKKNNVGVSLISVNSPKGEKILKMSRSYLDYEETSKDLALKSCRHLNSHPFENAERAHFFKMFFEEGYYAAAQKYIEQARTMPISKRIMRLIRKIID